MEKIRATTFHKGPNVDNSSGNAMRRAIQIRTQQGSNATTGNAHLHKGDQTQHMKYRTTFANLHRKLKN